MNNQPHEVRYYSPMLNGQALFGTYSNIENARTAALNLKQMLLKSNLDNRDRHQMVKSVIVC